MGCSARRFGSEGDDRRRSRPARRRAIIGALSSSENAPTGAPPRQSGVAAALLLAANVLFFWPVLFHGRVFSSHDAALAVFPWRATSGVETPRNRLLADPASAGAPLLRSLPGRFLWNRSTAGGAPGAINAVQGYLSPFAWAPALLLPEAAIESGILFLKLNAGFLFLFLFLRGRGLSEMAASCGAAAWGWSTAQSAWWLWMQSSVTVCFPLALLAIDRARRDRNSAGAVGMCAVGVLALLSGGYPFMILFGAAAAGVYALVTSMGEPARESRRALARLTAGVFLAIAVLLPGFLVSVRSIRASGQREARAGLSRELELPWKHLVLYALPLAAGDTLRDDYRPLTASRYDNYMETAVGVGPVAVALALLGAAARRHRRSYFYGASLAVGTGAILYVPALRRIFESLPVLSGELFERIKILAIMGLAISAAVGAEVLADAARASLSRARGVAAILPFLVGLPLVAIAARFYPAVRPPDAKFTSTPGLWRLARESAGEPSRFLGTGWTLYPDLGSAFGLEDVRGHLFFEEDYRRLLASADPGIYGRTGTLLISDPATLRPLSPILDLLNVSTIAAAPGSRFPIPESDKIYDGPDIVLFRRPSVLPRFFLAERWQPGGTAAVALASRAMLSTTAFVEAGEAKGLDALPRTADRRGLRLTVEARGNASFRLRLHAPDRAVLVTSEKLFPPYWVAKIDGADAAPIRVNGLFFGLPIPAGDHVVEGNFRIPPSEVAVSALAAGTILALLLASRFSRRTAS